MLVAILTMIGGLVLLIVGADLLVRGAARLAAAAGISALVIGLTVVAYGTSAPELAVTVASAVRGQPDVAVGNVVGSNIFNILVILGLSALATPLVVARQVVRLDVPLMLLVTAVAAALALNGVVGRLEGVLLVAAALTHAVFSVWLGRMESSDAVPAFAENARNDSRSPGNAVARLRDVGLVVLGLATLVVGARLLVDAASALARSLGVSELMIGLTIVAAGTSLPEAATSIVAALRGERDIAVGNVVGSNIFNLLAVLGAAAWIAPAGVAVPPAALRFDVPVMLFATVLCLPIAASGYRIERWEGGLLVAGYGLYLGRLILSGTGSGILPAYDLFLLLVVCPGLLAAVAVPYVAQWRATRARSRAR